MTVSLEMVYLAVRDAKIKSLNHIKTQLDNKSYCEFLSTLSEYQDDSLESNIKILENISVFLLGWGVGVASTKEKP